MAGFIDKLKGWLQTLSKPGKNLPVANVDRRFDLQGRIGQGSMSKVFKAYDRDLGKTVCLKILDKIKTEKFEARFAGLNRPTEGEICMMMKHRNIVQTYEHGVTTKKEPYLVMELVDGVGLNFLIETKSPLLKGNRLNYLRQLADGLEYMHKTGFLHRDICPRNVMVTKDGVVKIIDLGLAIPYQPEFCKPGNRTGTTNYLAPELIKRQTTDHRVDMFALGVTAFETFTADTPWEKASSQQVLLSHMNLPPRDPRELVPKMNPRIAEFLLKSIQPDPKERYQNPAQFKAAMEGLPES